jgi:hypothetical protein
MIRRWLVVGLLAAGPILPVPPIPPAGGPPDAAAPIPNTLSQAPGTGGQQEGPRLSPEFFQLPYYDQSQGYSPGSRQDTPPARRQPFAPGFSVSVPLQQR